MKGSQIQNQMLQARLQQQKLTIEKLRVEQSKLAQYVEQFKIALKRKQQKQTLEATKRSNQNQQKLEKQLEKQVQNAKTMLKNYQHQLRNLQKKTLQQTYTSDDLMKVDQELKIKEIQLKEVLEQIKDLKLVKRKQEKLIEKKQKNQQNDGIKLTKLVEEVHKQKQMLQLLKIKSVKQEQQLKKKITQIEELSAKYKQKCIQTGETPLTFEEFKERRKEKQRKEDQSLNKQTQKIPKKIITVKEMIASDYHVQHIEPTQKNLQDFKIKKQVAENSLKLAQKKDEKQINDLRQKLERLKQQNKILQSKLAEKVKQKEEASCQNQELKLSRFTIGKKNSGTSSLSKNQNLNSHGNIKLQPIIK